MPIYRILLADDSPGYRASLIHFLQRNGAYEIVEAEDGLQAWRQLHDGNRIDCAVLDYDMPGMDGLEIAKRLNNTAPHIPVIIVTAGLKHPQDWVEGQAELANVMYADKEQQELIKAKIDSSVYHTEHIELAPEVREHLEDLGFVHESEQMKKVVQEAVRAARSDANVLITGERGVGKNRLAEVIHELSQRGGTFVPVSCPVLAANPDLFAANMFGHSIGAFTGAKEMRKSIFEEAGDGTVFLDEIAAIPPESQALLLDFIESRQYRRTGENTPRPIHCRFISATNVDLGESVQRGWFKADLLDRLDTIHIHIPPLRSRQEDFKKLLSVFNTEFERNHHRRFRFDDDVFGYLRRQLWEGNTRELKNVFYRAALAARSETLSIGYFSHVVDEELRKRHSAQDQVSFRAEPEDAPRSEEKILEEAAASIFAGGYHFNLKETLKRFHRRLIEKSLEFTKSNIRKAERDLWQYTGNGTLRKQIKDFGIDPNEFKE